MDRILCEKMYETYYMRVYSFVMTLAGNSSLAEEITQETFYRALLSEKTALSPANEKSSLYDCFFAIFQAADQYFTPYCSL